MNISRREAIKSIAAGFITINAARAIASTPEEYSCLGRVPVLSPLGKLVKRVTVNGMDVTKFGFDGDDRGGWVAVHKWDTFPNPPTANSLAVVDRQTHEVEKAILRGVVRFTLKQD